MSEESVQPVIDEESLAHFIEHRSEIIPTKHKVRYNAFLPSRHTLSLSVFRIDGLKNSTIWGLGDEFVGNVIARGDLYARDYLAEELEIQPTMEPHPLHANVMGWPEEKQKQNFIAKNLASRAILHIREETP